MLRVTAVNSKLFEFVYASQFRVSVPCDDFVPRVDKIHVRRVEKTRSKNKDAYPELNDLFMRAACERASRKKGASVVQVSSHQRI